MRQGMAAGLETGPALNKSYHLALLAEVYAKVGQPTKGLALLEEALGVVEQSEERWYEAELYRLKGELTLQQSSAARRQSSSKNPQAKRPKSR